MQGWVVPPGWRHGLAGAPGARAVPLGGKSGHAGITQEEDWASFCLKALAPWFQRVDDTEDWLLQSDVRLARGQITIDFSC